MANGVLGRLLHYVRRIIGTAYILDERAQIDAEHEDRHRQQRQLHVALSNAERYRSLDRASLESLAAYQRARHLVARLTPMDLDGAQFVRVGRPNDGGYVMVEGFGSDTVDLAYSFGIGRDASWDSAMAARDIPVLMFDDCISSPPPSAAGCRFIPLGVTGRRVLPTRRTLEQFVAEHAPQGSDRLILKMDIENKEWDVLDLAPTEVLDRFSQVVIELHDLTTAVYDEARLSQRLPVLDKLNRTHQVVHVHGNATTPRPPVWIGPLVVPDALEVTYVRRRDVEPRLRPNTRIFPTALDQPTHLGGPDLFLGHFSVD